MLDNVTASIPGWVALFLLEFDGYSRDTTPPQSEHFVFRHYPGEGSWSMAWVINYHFHDYVQGIDWHGRAGSVLLNVPQMLSGSSHPFLYIVGVHGAHSDALVDSLTDVVTLIKRKPRFAQLLLLGDWNVDLLPTLQVDPWHDVPRRSEPHPDRRRTLESF